MTAHLFHKSSFRPAMMLGAERKPMTILIAASGGLLLIGHNVVAIAVASGLWLTIYPMLVWMGKIDPDLVSIYFRNLGYPKYIPAFTTPFRKAVGYRIPKERKAWKN